MNRALLRVLAAALACSLPGCGGGDGATTPTPTVPTPRPKVRSVILEGSFSLSSFTFIRRPFALASTGILDVTVDWTFASSNVWVYVAQGECSIEQFQMRFQQDTCNFVVRSETNVPKPRMLELATAPAGTYVCSSRTAAASLNRVCSVWA